VRHREAKRHDERQAECEARAFANHGSIIHPPSAHVQLEVPARRLPSKCGCTRRAIETNPLERKRQTTE
jgi:hypothetical protein